MSRLREPDSNPSRDHRTSIVVAVISAVAVVLAAVLPKLFDRAGPQPGSSLSASATSKAPSATSPPASVASSLPSSDSTDVEHSALAVWRTLDTLPPLRRDAIAKAIFIGRSVEWGGVVTSIGPDPVGFLVGVKRRKAYSPIFSAFLDSAQYGIASTVRIDDSVIIRGRISHIDLLKGIWLKPATMVLHVH
jgi:hypothetical protein